LSQGPETNVPSSSAPSAVTLQAAFRYWLRLGFISFGGPAGQIAVMHRDLVEKKHWISEGRFLHALNYCMVLPGPEATQLAIYIGWLMHRTAGGILAGSLFVLPSLLILIGLSWVYMAFREFPIVAGVLFGIKPAVIAIVAFAAWRIGSRTLMNWQLRVIAVTAFVALFALRIPYPVIVLGAAVIGYLGGRLAPEKFALGAEPGKMTTTHPAAIIDDATPPPAHARLCARNILLPTLFGLALWIAAIALLGLWFGVDSPLTQMGWFFTKAALLTFGGAYAVLPYVYQGAVEQFQWLSAAQMMDGLALGESTPGPLIMIVSFVGFVGGWGTQVLGADRLFLAGSLAAVVVTFFTFLPSFVFVLAGGPLIESTRNDLRLSAPLTGITAAVVGVILSLAVFFAYRVLWPDGLSGRFDTASAILTVAAAAVLFRLKSGVIPLILGCGILGMLYRLVFPL
jgi:chromate transporter